MTLDTKLFLFHSQPSSELKGIWKECVFDFSIHHSAHYHRLHPLKSPGAFQVHYSSKRSRKMVTTRSSRSTTDRPRPPKPPLVSPKIWMNPDYNIDQLCVRDIRTILDLNHVQDDYARKFQQVDIFRRKVWPKILVCARLPILASVR